MSRWFLGLGPALLLVSCAVAFAQDGAAPAVPAASGSDYLLSLGPYGALVWGAYMLGKGMRVTVQVELSQSDRDLIESLGQGMIALSRRGGPYGMETATKK